MASHPVICLSFLCSAHADVPLAGIFVAVLRENDLIPTYDLYSSVYYLRIVSPACTTNLGTNCLMQTEHIHPKIRPVPGTFFDADCQCDVWHKHMYLFIFI